MPDSFCAMHDVAVDSKGNIFTCEACEGKRIQKFVYEGIGAVSAN